MSIFSPALPLARQLAAPLAAAVLASLCVVSTAAATTAAVGGHHRASVIDAHATVTAAPSRKEY